MKACKFLLDILIFVGWVFGMACLMRGVDIEAWISELPLLPKCLVIHDTGSHGLLLRGHPQTSRKATPIRHRILREPVWPW